MEMSSKASAAAGKRNKKSRGSGPAPQAVIYNGPVKLPTTKDESMILVNLSTAADVKVTSSSFTGTFNTVFSAADVTSSTDWAEYKGLYQEFRVVGVGVHFLPKFVNAYVASPAPNTFGVTQSNAVTPLYFCRSHGELTALTTQDQAVNHQDRVVAPVNAIQRCDIKMKETDEAQWQSTQSGTAGVFGIKAFMQQATQGTADPIEWGTVLQTFAVQFRTRVSAATAVVKAKPCQNDSKDEKSATGPQKNGSKSWF